MGRIQIPDEQRIASSSRSQETGSTRASGPIGTPGEAQAGISAEHGSFAEGTRPEVRRRKRSDSQPPRSRPSIQLNLLYQYRRLAFQRGQGRELGPDQSRRLRTIEALFVASAPGSDSAGSGPADSNPAGSSPFGSNVSDRRDVATHASELATPSFRQLEQIDALMRVSRVSAICQPVSVIGLGLEHAICLSPAAAGSSTGADGADDIADGAEVELIFDDEAVSGSYRFKARVAWSQPDPHGDADRLIGLELCGAPLLLRKGPPSDKTHSIIEKMIADRAAR